MRECAKCDRCYDDAVVVCPVDSTTTVQILSGPPLLSSRYRLLQLLGRSSLGTVYLAQDENLAEREVVVRLLEHAAASASGWEQVAARLASVQSEHVVEVTDFGTGPDGSFFIVMDRLSCGTFAELVERSGKMTPERVLTLLKQVAAGVQAIEERGLLHGALSPRNVFLEVRLTTLGGFTQEEIVRVSGFGWEQLRGVSGGGAASNSAEPGTIEFLAPEQLQPGSAVGLKADVYGMGALAYYLLSGRPPFAGDVMQVVVQKTMDKPMPLTELCPELPAEVATVVMKALLRDPIARTDSVGEFIAELESGVVQTARASSPAAAPRVSVEAPEGTTIFLDDEAQGDVGVGGTFSLLLVQPGVHLIRARYPNGAEDEGVLEVPANGNGGILHVQFTQTEPPELGSGRLAADVAEIQSDGLGSDHMVVSDDPWSYELEQNMPNDEKGTAAAAGAADQARVDCPKCGESNRATSKFCRICGGSIRPKPAAEPVPTPVESVAEPAPASEIPSLVIEQIVVESPPPPVAPAPPVIDAAPPPDAPEPLPPPVVETVPPPVIEPPPAPDPSYEIERARRELAAEEERLRALSASHRQQSQEPASLPEDEQEEFETVFQRHIPIPAAEEIPRNQAPTEELERAAPAIAAPVAPPPVDATPAPNPLPDTMGGAGGLRVEVPEQKPYRSPGRPKTMESAGGSFDSHLSDAAKGNAIKPDAGLERSQSYYLGMGAILGLIILAILGLIAFVVYWFILSK